MQNYYPKETTVQRKSSFTSDVTYLNHLKIRKLLIRRGRVQEVPTASLDPSWGPCLQGSTWTWDIVTPTTRHSTETLCPANPLAASSVTSQVCILIRPTSTSPTELCAVRRTRTQQAQPQRAYKQHVHRVARDRSRPPSGREAGTTTIKQTNSKRRAADHSASESS